ncbi:MAG: chemotaxis protein CheW, partial [Cyanobacteria bacterium P01_F01_bin.42]
DAGQIKVKAVQRGLISSEQAARMGEQEALNLVFLPGLSTAEQVTNLSGRGVGMDVVQTNIDKIGGSIDVSSQPGRGTSFKLKIPLTLAIIPTLIVSSGGERYAIPQVSLVELVRLEGEKDRRGIEMVHGAPVYRLRGKLLPLVYLNRELRLEPASHGATSHGDQEAAHNIQALNIGDLNADLSIVSPGTTKLEITASEASSETAAEDDIEALNILVLQAANKPFGLLVDAIHDTQEIVVKPLGKQLKSLSCFAGATIMGDGRVALILDVQGLAQRAHVISEAQEAALKADGLLQEQAAADRQQLLLFEGPNGRHMALPLARVTRLEKMPSHLVEGTDRQHVIQYRDQILPLIYLSSVLTTNPGAPLPKIEADTIEMLVVSVDDQRNVGLVVENIVDIVEEQILIKGTATQPEIQYSAVIQDRITELIDVDAIIRAGAPALLQTETRAEAAAV